jgi:hypothetical protein
MSGSPMSRSWSSGERRCVEVPKDGVVNEFRNYVALLRNPRTQPEVRSRFETAWHLVHKKTRPSP